MLPSSPITLAWLPETSLTIIKLKPCHFQLLLSVLQKEALKNTLFSVTLTFDECSVVCSETIWEQMGNLQPVLIHEATVERDWKAFRVVGNLDFSLTGILASLSQPLAQAGISIFALSTYNTDFILLKTADSNNAQQVLQAHGFCFQ